MRFAADVPNFGDFADPRVVADLERAEPMLRRVDQGPPPLP